MLSLDFDHNFTPDRLACLFEPRITIIAIGNDLYQSTQHVFSNRLVRLLEGNPIGVL